jgi:hypothetical protein
MFLRIFIAVNTSTSEGTGMGYRNVTSRILPNGRILTISEFSLPKVYQDSPSLKQARNLPIFECILKAHAALSLVTSEHGAFDGSHTH